MKRILSILVVLSLLISLSLWANKAEAQSSGSKVSKSFYATYRGSARHFSRGLRLSAPKTAKKAYGRRLRATRNRTNAPMLKPDEKDIIIAKLQKEIRQLKLRIRLLTNIKLRKSK